MKKNRLALALIFCLFFLWAISSNLLPTMIRQLMKTCELNTFEAEIILRGPCRIVERASDRDGAIHHPGDTPEYPVKIGGTKCRMKKRSM